MFNLYRRFAEEIESTQPWLEKMREMDQGIIGPMLELLEKVGKGKCFLQNFEIGTVMFTKYEKEM